VLRDNRALISGRCHRRLITASLALSRVPFLKLTRLSSCSIQSNVESETREAAALSEAVAPGESARDGRARIWTRERYQSRPVVYNELPALDLASTKRGYEYALG